MEAYRCILTLHDFFFYISREFRVGVPAPFINNTALLYALNRYLPEVQRLISGTKPHYSQDFPIFSLYATPASLYNDKRVSIGEKESLWQHESEPVKISYNSVDSPLVFMMKPETVALPKVGAYFKYPPLNTFEFFTIGGKGNNLIRIGKKLVPARLKYTKLQNVEKKSGKFKPNHAVNLLDLPKETEVLKGTLHIVPPTSIMSNAELNGQYLIGKINTKTFRVAKPDFTKYSGIKLD